MSEQAFRFSKLHGAGNSFIFIDLRDPDLRKRFSKSFKGVSRSNLAVGLCDLQSGIGADGFAIFEASTSKSYDVKWDFYNSDGSKAEMCGNAARCAGLYLKSVSGKKSTAKTISLKTGSGIVTVTTKNEDDISVEMAKVKNLKLRQSLRIAKSTVDFTFLNSGVPHAVIEDDRFDLTDSFRKLAKAIQKNKYFGPKSTNVTFYKVLGPAEIQSASFERGVFDFTLACGTGAVAAAVTYAAFNSKFKKITVYVPGGKLFVDVKGERPILTGPARKVGDFFVEPEVF